MPLTHRLRLPLKFVKKLKLKQKIVNLMFKNIFDSIHEMTMNFFDLMRKAMLKKAAISISADAVRALAALAWSMASRHQACSRFMGRGSPASDRFPQPGPCHDA
ncbi:hypothetical protein [Polaromonas sp. CG_9.11]|uniref:hypothetical protein n=1 Tax=Polaromonas sp. CG_9.11 TaxID=2787730 RepID=UPI0018C9C5D1|nr:hypothetical protein [Polaromonas sp. CG_9.11]